MSDCGRAVILLYHRVAEAPTDPFGLCVGPERFAGHLAVLREVGPIVPVRDLLDKVYRCNTNRHVISLTFDDGYADNLFVALPLLEHEGAPATFFVVPRQVERGAPFWWDELTSLIFRRPGAGNVRVVLADKEHTWPLDDSEGDATGWRAWQEPPTTRALAYRELWGLLQRLDAGQRESALDQLRAQLGDPATTARSLTGDELRHLARSELVEVGAHTSTHARLAELPRSGQEREIASSKRWLEEHLGTDVLGFSYPFGTPADYDDESVSIVRRTGFGYACAVGRAPVTRYSSRFELARLPVEDWEPDELTSRVSTLLGR